MSDTPNLALRYRPKTLHAIVGQAVVRVVLSQMVAKGRVPTGLLFTGVRGTGKTSAGRTLAAALNCARPSSDGQPCGGCDSCVSIFEDNNSLDVHEIDAASHGNVADVRKILEMLQYQVGAKKRVVLFDEAHSMSTEAFNALLKVLEEPPPDTVFVLLTTEPAKILKTVQSRLMRFEFNQISVNDIADRLRFICASEGLSAVEDDLLELIAERSNGGMRDAVMTLDQMVRVDVHTVAGFRQLIGEDDYGPAAVRAMAMGDVATTFEIVDAQLARSGDATAISTHLIATLKDVVVLHAGGRIRAQGVSGEVRRALLSLIPPDRAVAALREFWKLKTQVRAGDDPRALLDLAVVMVAEVLRGTRMSPQAATPPAEVKKLSLAEVSQLIQGKSI